MRFLQTGYPMRGGKMLTFGAALIGLGGLSLPTLADVRYTTQMTIGGADDTKTADPNDATSADAAKMTPTMRHTIFLKDMRQRSEMSIDAGPFHQTTIILTQCDTHQDIRLDPALKIYTSSPIGAMEFTPPAMPGMDRHKMSHDAGKGTQTTTFTTQDLGVEKITDLDTHHWMLTMRSQTSGCLGDTDSTTKMEVWVSDIKAGLDCPEQFAASRTIPNPSNENCQITYEMKGDMEAMRKIFTGMIVREKIYNGDKVAVVQDLRDYSQAALDDALFSVPADYKQVSSKDFDKAEQDALMKSMMNGMASGDNSSPGDASPTPDAPTDGKTPDSPPAKKKHGPFGIPIP